MTHINILWFFLLLALLNPSVSDQAEPKQDDDATRQAFLVSRPKKQTYRKAGAAKTFDRPIGLGLTLYQKDPGGNPIRVKTSQIFHQGDAARLMIEANIDGYFYLFHTENSEKPEMIFPHPRLAGGANRIFAHVPYEIPSRQEPDPQDRWFIFKDNPGIENLYFVIARKPLNEVPTGARLKEYCWSQASECIWRPPQELWAQIITSADVGLTENKSGSFGQPQTKIERDAVTRGFGLVSNAAAPSIVRINASPKPGMLITKIDLSHR